MDLVGKRKLQHYGTLLQSLKDVSPWVIMAQFCVAVHQKVNTALNLTFFVCRHVVKSLIEFDQGKWLDKAFDTILGDEVDGFFQIFGLTRWPSSHRLALDNERNSADCNIAPS